MSVRLATEADLADILGIPETRVSELRRRYGWPHVKIGRTFRFTTAHIEQIIASHTSAAPDSPAVVISGQTTRSASRRRSA